MCNKSQSKRSKHCSHNPVWLCLRKRYFLHIW